MSSERPAFKVALGLHLVTWLVNSSQCWYRTSPKWQGWFIMPGLCKQEDLCRTPAFLLGVWDYGLCSAKGAYRTLGASSLWASLVDSTCCHYWLLENEAYPAWLHWERTLGSLCLVSSRSHSTHTSLSWVCFVSFHCNESYLWVLLSFFIYYYCC